MYDVKIKDGSVAIDKLCRTEIKVRDVYAVLQRIETALSLKKGDFPYDKEMGVTIPCLDFSDERNLRQLEMYINEVAYTIWDCRIKLLQFNKDTRKAKLLVKLYDGEYEIEVNLFGEV